MNHAGYRDIGEFVARRNIIFHCFGYFSRYIVRALVDYYDKLDSETRQLVPLKRLYWPT